VFPLTLNVFPFNLFSRRRLASSSSRLFYFLGSGPRCLVPCRSPRPFVRSTTSAVICQTPPFYYPAKVFPSLGDPREFFALSVDYHLGIVFIFLLMLFSSPWLSYVLSDPLQSDCGQKVCPQPPQFFFLGHPLSVAFPSNSQSCVLPLFKTMPAYPRPSASCYRRRRGHDYILPNATMQIESAPRCSRLIVPLLWTFPRLPRPPLLYHL